jgi:hypothetical protein
VNEQPIDPTLLPAPFGLHACADDGCRGLAFGARCERHETPRDRELLHALDLALLAAAEAEESWRDARLRVAEAERAAGVRRYNAYNKCAPAPLERPGA